MRTKLQVLFVAFFFVFAGSAQYFAPRLLTFTDYGNCYYGLRDQKGDHLWPAEFTVLDAVQIRTNEKMSGYQFFWIAQKNGYYGVLNDSAEIVVPFLFEEVVPSQYGCFIAKKEKDILVYSLSGEKKYNGKDLDKIEPLKNGFIVSRNGQEGFLDLRFQERIPMAFTDLEPEYSPYVFHVFQGKNRGIYDLRRGIVVPCNYEFVEAHWANENCEESQAVYAAFRDTMLFIYDREGVLSVSFPDSNQPLFYQVPLDSCSTKAEAFVILHSSDKDGNPLTMSVINIETHERSKTYDRVVAKGNRFLCKTGKEWSVMDAHFREIGHWSKWNASWEPRLTDTFDLMTNQHVWWNFYLDPLGSELRNNQQVVIYSKPSKHSEFLSFGMYDYEANKSVPTNYYRIDKLEYRQKRVYWAFKIAKEHQKHMYPEMGPLYSQMDIYDENLDLVRSFRGGEIPNYYKTDQKSAFDQLLVYAKGDLVGAVNAMGEEIIPAKYRNYAYIKEEIKGKDTEVFYLFGNDLLGMYDYTGRQVIPELYKQYMSLGSLIIALDANKTYTVYSRDGNKLLDGISTYFLASNGSGDRGCSYYLKNRDPDASLSFFVKGDELFYLQGETFSPVGPGTIGFTSVYLRLNKEIIINQQGKVVDVGGMSLKAWKYGCPEQLNELPVQVSNAMSGVKKSRKSLNYHWQHIVKYDSREEYWEVRNLSGIKLSTRRFDYPFNSVSKVGKIYREKDRYGLMRDGFDEVLPPVYDYIYPTEKSYVGYKKTDSLWTYFGPDGQSSPDSYDIISLYYWKGGNRFVFKDGKVGILTDSATYLVPLTDSLEFLRKYDLIKLLHLDKSDAFDLRTSYNLVTDSKPEEIYRQINNGQILWYCYHYSTNTSIMRINPADVEFLADFGDIYFRRGELISEKIPSVHTSFYYTEQIKSYSRYVSAYYEFPSRQEYKYAANNFKIANGKLIPIRLENLIPDASSMKRLDELLIKKLNEKQYFGKDCIDMDSKLSRLKSNFLLTSHSLVFYWQDLPRFQIEIYFSDLNGILSSTIRKQVSEF